MKKLISLILCLLLLACLPVAALAYDVVLSPQNLSVDGQLIDCEKYNIDGSNYFKLRDLAYILMGTDAQFGVSYSAEENSILIVPGMPYEPVGGELEPGADKSSSAVPSAQSVLLNNARPEGLSVYNIGGNNFFKLRDLAPLLGFTVDYDADTNTAVILTSAQMAAFDAVWNWMQEHYTHEIDDGVRYYKMEEKTGDNGDSVEFWLGTAPAEAYGSEPVLVLYERYFWSDGNVAETWLYLTREGRPYSALDEYYFTYSQTSTDPDYSVTVTVDPAAFDQAVPLSLDSCEPADLEQEYQDILAGNVTMTISGLVKRFNELLSSTPELCAVASMWDFGFTGAALPG